MVQYYAKFGHLGIFLNFQNQSAAQNVIQLIKKISLNHKKEKKKEKKKIDMVKYIIMYLIFPNWVTFASGHSLF